MCKIQSDRQDIKAIFILYWKKNWGSHIVTYFKISSVRCREIQEKYERILLSLSIHSLSFYYFLLYFSRTFFHQTFFFKFISKLLPQMRRHSLSELYNSKLNYLLTYLKGVASTASHLKCYELRTVIHESPWILT